MTRFPIPRLLFVPLGIAAVAAAGHAQDTKPGVNKGTPDAKAATWSEAQQKGIDFLAKQQKDGVFSVTMRGQKMADPGFSALALAAVQSKPKALRSEAEQKCIDSGLTWLLTNQNEDGSFGTNVPNYTTCAAVMALARWPDERRLPALQKAQKYVLAIQNCEATGSSRSDIEYGGVGYGSKRERSDLSNLQFAVSALRDSGLATDHDAFARAVVFLQRTQNLKSVNDLGGKVKVKGADGTAAPLAIGDDGGGVYYPGESPAGNIDLPDGSRMPRSYGSMTYALLKTYTLCGIKAADPRVQAAVKWISSNWTVLENPGADAKLGESARYQGLYYYYLLLAQALEAVGLDRIETTKDGKPVTIDWRADLRKQVESLQRADGAWINDRSDRWYENLDILCTCYALLALQACR